MVNAQTTQPTVIVIDATDLIVGRLATRVAREALHGKTIRIINCDKAVVSGTKTFLVGEWKRRFVQGVPRKGPYVDRFPDRMVRRVIRGMLGYHDPRGRAAYERVMCYIGVPAEFKQSTTITFEDAKVSKLPKARYMTIAAICKEMGGKWHE